MIHWEVSKNSIFPTRIHDFLPADFEADLKEVWSVRKNIHHTGGPAQQIVSSSNSSTGLGAQAKKGLYSRHGAIPSQSIKSTWGSMTQVQGTAKDSFGRGEKSIAIELIVRHVCAS